MLIKEVRARKILDSRGEPTIEVNVNGSRASSPSGKSTGKYETKPYKNSLEWNIKFFNNCKFNLKINSFDDLKLLEKEIRGKAKIGDVKMLGANALFALESAVLKALAISQRKELWQIVSGKSGEGKMSVPVGNIIGGGLHSHNKNAPVFQEFLIIPLGESAKENFKIMQDAHAQAGRILMAKRKNDEGAWETSLNEEEIFEILSKIKCIKLGADIAASSFYFKGNYTYKNKTLDKRAHFDYVKYLIKKFNLLYVEDPLQEEDFSGFAEMHKLSKGLIVGDDLTATQINRVNAAIRRKAINAMIIKPNQNGSLLELKKIFEICRKNKIKTILSHRSGETLDDALADYAVGFGADFIKCGIATKWREVKLKRLVEIEKELR